jgi:hypothetical protein
LGFPRRVHTMSEQRFHRPQSTRPPRHGSTRGSHAIRRVRQCRSAAARV